MEKISYKLSVLMVLVIVIELSKGVSKFKAVLDDSTRIIMISHISVTLAMELAKLLLI